MVGDVIIDHPGGVLREQVHKGKNGPNKLRNVHEVRVIGDHYVAVGMRRQVYQRKLTGGSWSRFDAGVRLPDASKDIAGFTSVDGFSDDEIYAVGHNGEIWLAQGGQWRQIESPTNAYLQCVRCGSNGEVLICGAGGVVLRGRQSQWKVVDPGGVDTTLQSAAQLAAQWYVADEEGGLHVVTENGLKPDSQFEALGLAAGTLDSNEDTLLCVGIEDLASFDGKKWRHLPHPPIDPT
jgi:hypothetical protein